jgi:hypothetical protein
MDGYLMLQWETGLFSAVGRMAAVSIYVVNFAALMELS